MTDATQAYEVLRARLEATPPTQDGEPIGLRWQNEDGDPLPDTPAPFAYSELITDRARIAGFGGGRGANLYRVPAAWVSYVFVPKGWGLRPATQLAEQIAAVFRSHRDADVSCFEASVMPGGDGADLTPPGLSRDLLGNYFWAAVEVSLTYDQIG